MVVKSRRREPDDDAANLRVAREFSARLGGELSDIGLMDGHFDVTLVDDAEMAELNRKFRGLTGPTDVLSFRWRNDRDADDSEMPAAGELAGFLGDIVIAVQTAERNARAEGHSLQIEIRQLILHGLLHLLGYDHETDHGEMTVLELRLRGRLGIEGRQKTGGRRQ
jgi:probable rRNA maturation factor